MMVDEAASLIAGIEDALERNILHFRKSDGAFLTTMEEILESIQDKGVVTFQPDRGEVG